jgi:hypothetical protein
LYEVEKRVGCCVCGAWVLTDVSVCVPGPGEEGGEEEVGVLSSDQEALLASYDELDKVKTQCHAQVIVSLSKGLDAEDRGVRSDRSKEMLGA